MTIIRKLRKARGLTQAQLASELGVGQSTVAMWENGINVPSSNMLPLLARTLNCSIDKLFQETDDTSQPTA